MIKAIIVDDEPYCSEALSILLKRYCPQVDVVGSYHSGAEALDRIREQPPQLLFLDIEMPRMNGFEMLEKGIPRHDYEIKDFSGAVIGKVTSGTQSPSLGKAIGMGYVRIAFANIDTKIYIKVRDKLLQARVTKLPFS